MYAYEHGHDHVSGFFTMEFYKIKNAHKFAVIIGNDMEYSVFSVQCVYSNCCMNRVT